MSAYRLYSSTRQNWCLSLWNDGTVYLFSTYNGTRRNQRHSFHLYDPIEPGCLPMYVLSWLYQVRDANRQRVRNLLSLRIRAKSAASSHPRVRLSWSRALDYEQAGLWYRPWSSLGRKVIFHALLCACPFGF